MSDHPGDPTTDGSDESPSAPPPSAPDRVDEARPLLRLALIGVVATVLAAGASRALRSIDAAPPAVDGLATVLAVASVLLLVTTLGAAVLWVLVRFLSPDR